MFHVYPQIRDMKRIEEDKISCFGRSINLILLRLTPPFYFVVVVSCVSIVKMPCFLCVSVFDAFVSMIRYDTDRMNPYE